MDLLQSGIGMTSERTRERLVNGLRREGIRDERVLEVMRTIPRHLFVEEALASRAYENTALPIGMGQTISQPYIVARMTEALLDGGELDRVLEVGTGSGYQTAVLAPLVRRIYTVERIGALLEQARARFRLLRLRNIHPRHADGSIGLPEFAPYDGIIVTAAPEGIPRQLVEQLRPGARMVLPIGGAEGQALVRVTRTARGYDTELLEPVNFVPLLGGVDS
ncbi:MAG TPA: protein-L-isoaspartate(D-aspartate) O-methyltransferase [Thiolapillus brandeum]|uniref:Protein-L-isoaspartate O-methyltransferase n=1 Tax=Thiolapillus brandeum TaxID=1076588 RepID=A0A7C5MXL8_9GAMM|nr:protein-L-isoaspartate(D-aspartate) O-methyltransferase [Thiolapillus brandeum]